MEEEKRTRIIDEIKQIERQLYLRKSQFAVLESKDGHIVSDAKDWRWIEQVGLISVGDNSTKTMVRYRRLCHWQLAASV